MRLLAEEAQDGRRLLDAFTRAHSAGLRGWDFDDRRGRVLEACYDRGKRAYCFRSSHVLYLIHEELSCTPPKT